MKFTVIGISDSQHPFLGKEAMEALRNGHVFSGGIRHHAIVGDLLPEGSEWIDIKVPLDDVFKQYTRHDHVVVFASGDPLFYGFANTILRKLPDAEIEVIPYFNSLQTLAHRLSMIRRPCRCRALQGDGQVSGEN